MKFYYRRKSNDKKDEVKETGIWIKGEYIKVSKEVYDVYYKMSRRERYLIELSRKYEVSYDGLVDIGFPIEDCLLNKDISQRGEAILQRDVKKIDSEILEMAISKLTSIEKDIIEELILNYATLRDVAVILSIPKSTLWLQEKRILKKLKGILEKI